MSTLGKLALISNDPDLQLRPEADKVRAELALLLAEPEESAGAAGRQGQLPVHW